MTAIFAEAALLPDGWARNVRIRIADGALAAVAAGAAPEPGDERAAVVIPGAANLHSHAFQRAMAGFAERRGPGADTFWSWRETMYRFALAMTADQLEAVAAQLYIEMLEAGFTRVGEFHYLHHAPDGTAYADPAELAGRIATAAQATGIGLTLLPVFYARAGFGGAPATEGQRRFVTTPDAFADLVARCRALAAGLPGAVAGVAPHSLRAATPEDLATVVALADGSPVHIHVAEQVREVEDCLAWSGARPVEWLLDHAPVDGRWCLIHATHMTADEVGRLRATGAVAGLCPITEANLGDGIFPAEFLRDGAFGVGSDSNVAVSLADELRQLEYSQRLALRARNVVAAPGGSTGDALLARAVAGGAQALGIAGGLAPGCPADIVSLDTAAAPHLPHDRVLDAWIFAAGAAVDRVWARGRCVVEGGRHVAAEATAVQFRAAMAELLAAL